jgi:hypothetical protein
MKQRPKRAAPTCLAPDEDGRLCGRPATQTRLVEELVWRLCAWHAAELDENDDDNDKDALRGEGMDLT